MEDQFRAWWQESYGLPPGPHAVMTHVAWGEHLLATRPKPPSLKEQAIKLIETYEWLIETHEFTGKVKLTSRQCDTIRRALEALPE